MADLFYSLQNTIIMGLSGLGLFMLLRRGLSRQLRVAGFIILICGLTMLLMHPTQRVDWKNYGSLSFDEVLKNENDILLYFSADWCYPCYQLERFTFTQPEVAEALQPFYKIKVDMSDRSDLKVKEIVKEFKIVSIPELVCIKHDAEGNRIKKRLAGFRSAREIREWLKSF